MADSEMTPLRIARHAMRGKMNLLKLCVAAMSMCETPVEVLDYADEIEKGCDALVVALDEFERLMEAEGK